jgi:hypothetical protein
MRTIAEHGQVLMIPEGSLDEGPLLRSAMQVTDCRIMRNVFSHLE